MRWKLKQGLPVGTVRTHYFFAWWPVKINNECRWLEYVHVVQRLGWYRTWVNINFLDNDKK